MYGNARTYSHGGVDASQRTRVTFVVRCKDVDPGKQEHLFVLGDAVPLGSWSVAHAVPMMREERASTPEPTTSLATATGGGGGDGAGSALALLPGAPHGSRGAPWCATVELDSGTQVDYKYCILVRDPVTGAIDLAQEPRFEPFEGNRVLKVFGVGMRVDDRKFGEPFMATDESRIRVNYGRVFSRFEAPKSESLDCTSDGAVASARNAPLRSGLAATPRGQNPGHLGGHPEQRRGGAGPRAGARQQHPHFALRLRAGVPAGGDARQVLPRVLQGRAVAALPHDHRDLRGRHAPYQELRSLALARVLQREPQIRRYSGESVSRGGSDLDTRLPPVGVAVAAASQAVRCQDRFLPAHAVAIERDVPHAAGDCRAAPRPQEPCHPGRRRRFGYGERHRPEAAGVRGAAGQLSRVSRRAGAGAGGHPEGGAREAVRARRDPRPGGAHQQHVRQRRWRRLHAGAVHRAGHLFRRARGHLLTGGYGVSDAHPRRSEPGAVRVRGVGGGEQGPAHPERVHRLLACAVGREAAQARRRSDVRGWPHYRRLGGVVPVGSGARLGAGGAPDQTRAGVWRRRAHAGIRGLPAPHHRAGGEVVAGVAAAPVPVRLRRHAHRDGSAARAHGARLGQTVRHGHAGAGADLQQLAQPGGDHERAQPGDVAERVQGLGQGGAGRRARLLLPLERQVPVAGEPAQCGLVVDREDRRAGVALQGRRPGVWRVASERAARPPRVGAELVRRAGHLGQSMGAGATARCEQGRHGGDHPAV
eukprot:ctg_505.g183